jgi:hypothetical protein
MLTSTTADASANPRPMAGWIRSTLFATATFIVCWVAAIIFWRTGKHSPTIVEIGLCLFGLPLLALSGWFLNRKIMVRPHLAPSLATSSVAPSSTAVPSQNVPLAILATALRAPHGASAEELAAAIAANKARPDLDQELLDDDGFPIMTARCHEVRDIALEKQIVNWLSDSGFANLEFTEEQWRALTLGSTVCAELASHAAKSLMPQEGTVPVLQVVPVLPSDWPVVQRRAAGMWLKYTAAQCGWPSERIAPVSDDWTELAVPSLVAISKKLAQVAVASDVPVITMIVACASNLGESTVGRWSAAKTLFSASNPQGAVAGEGAAGLLVTDMTQTRLHHIAQPAALELFAHARSVTSVDETRRIDPAPLDEVIDRVISCAFIGSNDIAMVVIDDGHRSNRMLELMGHISPRMPQLNVVEDVVRVGLNRHEFSRHSTAAENTAFRTRPATSHC